MAAGLDSMVIGEDQILGQVKTAHKQAREAGTTGVYLNTFFRMAVTGAKKVKTETELSKTSVSTATLALKVAEEELGTLKDKRFLSSVRQVRLWYCSDEYSISSSGRYLCYDA